MVHYNGTILVTLDGIRRKDIFNKNNAYFLNSISNNTYVKVIDNMNVANGYKISYPGYNDILTGKVNKNIKTNNPIYNDHITFFEYYNLKPVLSVSWCRFKHIYNTIRSKLKILNKTNKTNKTNKNTKYNNINCVDYNLDNKKCILTDDCKTFKIFCYYWKKNKEKIKCGHLGFVGSDEAGHDKLFNIYIDYIKYYDKCIEYIWKHLLPETLIITTDHGRGNKKWDNHYNNIKGSDDVWCIIISRNKNKIKDIKNVLSDKPVNTDIYKLLEHFIIL